MSDTAWKKLHCQIFSSVWRHFYVGPIAEHCQFSKSICPKHCSCISANCCTRASLLSSICSIFTTEQYLKVVDGFIKIALTTHVVPDTDTALWRKLSKCSTSTDQPGSLLNIVAYMQHTDWNNPLCPLWVVLDFCNMPEKKDGGHLSELGFLAPKWWGNSSAGSLMYSKCDGWVELLSYARLSALCNSAILWHVA